VFDSVEKVKVPVGSSVGFAGPESMITAGALVSTDHVAVSGLDELPAASVAVTANE